MERDSQQGSLNREATSEDTSRGAASGCARGAPPYARFAPITMRMVPPLVPMGGR